MLINDLKDKNIALWGLGTEGAASLEYLQKHKIGKSIKVFKDDSEVDLNGVDIIIKSPGVSVYKNEIIRAKADGIIVTSSSDIFLDEVRTNQPECKIIGISGSKGKSTSVSALYHMMKTLGLNVGLGGNIGKPLIELIDSGYDYIICEFSSYQTADLRNSPHIAMFTNLFFVHTDWHHGHQNYCKDKVHLIANQKDGDVFFVNARNDQLKLYCEVYPKYRDFYNQPDNFHAEGRELFYQDQKLLTIDELKLSGNHNLDNLAGVFSIIKYLGLDIKAAVEALKSFEPLPHRLQKVALCKGVLFINDSISTAPEAAIGGMKSFEENLAVISGGIENGQDYTEYARFVAANPKVKMVIALYQNGPAIAETLRKYVKRNDFKLIETENLEQGVVQAYEELQKSGGGIVLFSPTSPSFGYYKNFMERGQHFINIVEALKAE